MFAERFLGTMLVGAMLLCAGCQYTEGRETQTGALVGAASGAGLGAIIGHQTGDAGAGALIGGAAGALLGGGVGYAMENQRKRFETELENVQVVQRQNSIVLTMSDQVLFEFDSASLTPNAMRTLDEVVMILRDPEYQIPRQIVVTGHTDSTGDENYNLRLSQRRAESVRSYLVSRGISSSVVVAQGMGESMPVAPNTTSTNRALNRRVEIEIIP